MNTLTCMPPQALMRLQALAKKNKNKIKTKQTKKRLGCEAFGAHQGWWGKKQLTQTSSQPALHDWKRCADHK